jgi:hypothetical protein
MTRERTLSVHQDGPHKGGPADCNAAVAGGGEGGGASVVRGRRRRQAARAPQPRSHPLRQRTEAHKAVVPRRGAPGGRHAAAQAVQRAAAVAPGRAPQQRHRTAQAPAHQPRAAMQLRIIGGGGQAEATGRQLRARQADSEGDQARHDGVHLRVRVGERVAGVRIHVVHRAVHRQQRRRGEAVVRLAKRHAAAHVAVARQVGIARTAQQLPHVAAAGERMRAAGGQNA